MGSEARGTAKRLPQSVRPRSCCCGAISAVFFHALKPMQDQKLQRRPHRKPRHGDPAELSRTQEIRDGVKSPQTHPQKPRKTPRHPVSVCTLLSPQTSSLLAGHPPSARGRAVDLRGQGAVAPAVVPIRKLRPVRNLADASDTHQGSDSRGGLCRSVISGTPKPCPCRTRLAMVPRSPWRRFGDADVRALFGPCSSLPSVVGATRPCPEHVQTHRLGGREAMWTAGVRGRGRSRGRAGARVTAIPLPARGPLSSR